MSEHLLAGQVAIVTGCARMKGLGRSIALELARAGARLVVSDVHPTGTRNQSEAGQDELDANWGGLSSLIEEIEGLGSSAVAVIGDVGAVGDAQRMVDEAISALGKVDILVNNAAASHGADRDWFWNVPVEAFDKVMHVNAKGTFLMAQAVARHLIERGGSGRIINISSVGGKLGMPQRATYCASKFAIVGLTQAMAAELGEHDITVNAVCPGAVETARARSRRGRIAETGTEPAGVPTAPIARTGVPDDVARVVRFLADPAAGFITGESVAVNGGMVMD